MELLFFCPRWGSEQLDWRNFLTTVKKDGYDGVEWAISSEISVKEINETFQKINDFGLKIIAQHFDTYTANFYEHRKAYIAWLNKIKDFNIYAINSQTGKDFFSMEQNQELIDEAQKISVATGINIYHETHRGKFSFAAHVTKKYMEADAHLKITLDASHCLNVAESYLEDQPEAMNLAISRTEHIHARVGHPEGPQISDPAAPEFSQTLDTHLKWWDTVVKRKETEDKEARLSITPEFGPSPYLFTLPYTQQPVVSQWKINLYMMDLLKKRYAV